jgi:hypothetical protein
MPRALHLRAGALKPCRLPGRSMDGPPRAIAHAYRHRWWYSWQSSLVCALLNEIADNRAVIHATANASRVRGLRSDGAAERDEGVGVRARVRGQPSPGRLCDFFQFSRKGRDTYTEPLQPRLIRLIIYDVGPVYLGRVKTFINSPAFLESRANSGGCIFETLASRVSLLSLAARRGGRGG